MISSFAGILFVYIEYCYVMSAKRNLPAWMVASDPKSGKDEQIRESLKRKPEVKTNKRVRKKCIKRMMYWMNESELVETALGVIKRDKREAAAADRCAPLNTEMTVVPETDHEETTDSDVSDPAVDYAEQETVPYSECIEKRNEQRLASSAGVHKEAVSEEDKSETDPDPEALQVLRDIFFS
ncbi:hypothetical protein QTP70_019721 [Hemibagrus guttatus]|uniref:Uncharacterized protein n=1 Tax=Hemibagrus guttatus TaxID=175788 RepID=A0AAE0V1V9_9TELE|nr:hypothetical protein QTP70_019721 [Hemibagrus guttatus]KAK3564649.1 hypothetical protein QTP86_024238 [Hemibagrus guttatus]